MLRLRVLGAVDLRDDEGRDLDVVLAQPKRLALLVYLALARPPGFHRREVLLSLFWPESDHGTARNALRQTLHYLRHYLGDGVIVSRGENDVGISKGMLWCDAAAFTVSLDGGEDEEALALYRGDLMPGTLIGDAPDFNRWLDDEREHLRTRLEGALEREASESERRGDFGSVVRARRRGAALEPLSARAALELMHALVSAGDRAAAIHHATTFTRALREELGVEEDDGVTTFAAELRGDPRSLRVDPVREGNPRAATTSQTTAHADGLGIVILPFAIHGDEAYRYLEQGMVDLLSRTLDHAGALRAVDPYAVIGLTNRSGAAPADPELGSLVARRFGAELFVLGSVVGAVGRLKVFATLYHVEKGRLVTAEASVAGEGALFDIVEDVTRQLVIGRLGPAEQLTRLAATLTPSIEALKAYLMGESEYRRGCFGPARAALERAVADDPAFGLAWYRLAQVAWWLHQPELSQRCTQRAVTLSDRLRAHDRALLEAFLASLQGHARDAERRYREVLDAHPDNVEAWLGLGQVLLLFNPFRGRRSSEAQPPFGRVLELDPGNGAARMLSAYVSAKKGDVVEFRANVGQWDEKSEFSIYPRAMHALSQGTREERDAVIAELALASDATVYEAVRYVARLTCNLPGAARIARLLADPPRSPAAKAHGHILAAQLAVAAGQHRGALEELVRASRFDPHSARAYRGLFAVLPFLPVPRSEIDAARVAIEGWDGGDGVPEAAEDPVAAVHACVQKALRLYVLGHLHARGEAFDAALRTADQLAAQESPPMAPVLVDDWARGVRAHVAWRQGRSAHALALLEGARLEPPYAHLLTPSPFLSQNLERYLRAQLLEIVGRDEDALRWYECVPADFVHEVVFLAPSHLRRATIHERRGEHANARDLYQRFIALWRDAEPEEAAVVADAQRRLIRLGGRVVREG
jgi:DNA-binding SARP family transcriptional activator